MDFLSNALAGNRFVRIAIRAYGYEQKVVERSLRQQLDVVDDRFENDILSEDGTVGIVAELLNELPDEHKRRSAEIERRIERLKNRIESACAGNGDFHAISTITSSASSTGSRSCWTRCSHGFRKTI